MWNCAARAEGHARFVLAGSHRFAMAAETEATMLPKSAGFDTPRALTARPSWLEIGPETNSL